MRLRVAVAALGVVLAAVLPVWAEVSAPVMALSKALRMAEVMAVLHDEGLQGGAELAADLPGGPNDPQWKATLDRLYDPATLQAAFDLAFEKALGNDATAIAEGSRFFGSELGQRALGLEIEVRRAFLDPAVEEAAKAAFVEMEAKQPARLAMLRQFVKANDLIESNVMGSLNSNLAFFRGMAAEGDGAYAMTESDMLAEVWAGEAQARKDTEDWLYPFLATAYAPLSDEELQAYLTFSETPAGKTVNAAMFAAFDQMFVEVSTNLGRAVARQMVGQDI